MTQPSEQMMAMHTRGDGIRDLRFFVPDARADTTRERVAQQAARLSPAVEQDALNWIEAVSKFDEGQ